MIMKFFHLKKQRGAVLAFSLVMLLLLTLAATRMIQQNKQQLEMANNARLVTQEFANAEGLLAEAKNIINKHAAHTFQIDANGIMRDESGTPINNSSHQCIPTTSFKQNILLAGKELFQDTPILQDTTIDSLPKASILEVRCKSESNVEQICSSYSSASNTVTCKPKSGNTTCSGVTIDDITIQKFNSADDLCYQNYDPQGSPLNTICNTDPRPAWCTGAHKLCPQEIYKIQVISTDSNGTKRQIISDHVVGCG